MRLPIDTSRLKFLVVAEAEPLRQFEEGKPREAWAPRTDTNGEVLWRVQLVALGDGEAEIIRVAVPGDPKVAQGEMVAVDGLTAQAWEMDGRSGMSFRARAIRSGAGPAQASRGEGGGVMTRAVRHGVPSTSRRPPWNHRYLVSDGEHGARGCTSAMTASSRVYGTARRPCAALGEADLAAATEPDARSGRGRTQPRSAMTSRGDAPVVTAS